ncbi:hotdog domain-containing protein [Halomicrococcus sp. SG-WS-1]|uniref:hotdog domain-containing protein n=1 Tax=Halomicrococcus sp. SG-WS-1 TaxID=3439057 RepID=UPI003F798441
MVDVPDEGDVATYSRTFTEREVEQFADLSGDQGTHHEGDRPMVHGLLTATLPTKIGGDMDYVARSMEFEFRRPVYVGEEVSCESRVERVDEHDDRYEMAATFVCRNGDDEVVLEGRTEGVIFR